MQVEIHGNLQQVEEMVVAVHLALPVEFLLRVQEGLVRVADHVQELVQRLSAFHLPFVHVVISV